MREGGRGEREKKGRDNGGTGIVGECERDSARERYIEIDR